MYLFWPEGLTKSSSNSDVQQPLPTDCGSNHSDPVSPNRSEPVSPTSKAASAFVTTAQQSSGQNSEHTSAGNSSPGPSFDRICQSENTLLDEDDRQETYVDDKNVHKINLQDTVDENTDDDDDDDDGYDDDDDDSWENEELPAVPMDTPTLDGPSIVYDTHFESPKAVPVKITPGDNIDIQNNSSPIKRPRSSLEEVSFVLTSNLGIESLFTFKYIYSNVQSLYSSRTTYIIIIIGYI